MSVSMWSGEQVGTCYVHCHFYFFFFFFFFFFDLFCFSLLIVPTFFLVVGDLLDNMYIP